jgi:hypothetical protein
MSVTLSHESRAALDRLSRASGVASSQFVSQLVHDAIPVLTAMAEAFEVARTSPSRAAELMQSATVAAMARAAQAQLEFEAVGKRKKRKLRRRPRTGSDK